MKNKDKIIEELQQEVFRLENALRKIANYKVASQNIGFLSRYCVDCLSMKKIAGDAVQGRSE